jgi:hypothetical protein
MYPYSSAQPSGPTSVANSETYRPEPHLHKVRRDSKKLKLPVDIRRASSSPHMVGMVQGIDTASPGSDKRRNKLGYQRTTIACGKYTLIWSFSMYCILIFPRSLQEAKDQMSSTFT